MNKYIMNLSLFGGEGAVVNTTVGYTNANTGAVAPFDNNYSLDPIIKTYYDTELLENSRDQRYFAQFGKKQPLPKGRGKSVEWRKWNTLPPAMKPLQEGVNPTGRKLSETSITKQIAQYGDYVEKSDVLDLHAIDDVGLGATEELGSAMAQTQDLLIRNELLTGTNVMYADCYSNGSYNSTPAAGYEVGKNGQCYLTPDMVAQVATQMQVDKVPMMDGRYYTCIIHPYTAYDIRKSEDWTEAHKYAAVEEIFNGEIGELHGVRFIQTTNAKVNSGNAFGGANYYLTGATSSASTAEYGIASANVIGFTDTLTNEEAEKMLGRAVLVMSGSSTTVRGWARIVGVNKTSKAIFLEDAVTGFAANDRIYPGDAGWPLNGKHATFACTFLGKDAYGIIDPHGAGAEMIYHDKRIAGGPLELKSTIGYKFEQATAILYQERILRLEVDSKFSSSAEDVLDQE